MNTLVQLQNNQLINETEIIQSPNYPFIGGNSFEVTLEHLKNDCIIPVFSKDNESTISHFQFINETFSKVKELFPNESLAAPEIRVSHMIKGRVPSAIGKPANQLQEDEKTIYYERCAFIIKVHSIKRNINNNELSLCIGGVRSYNQENLYSKKTVEKFKLFIGFQNKVCTNLCISSDGFTNEIRVTSAGEIAENFHHLVESYNHDEHFSNMELFNDYSISETQFAHLIGKIRMYYHMGKENQKLHFPILLNDGQINNVVRDYFECPNFKKNNDGSISLWNLYNLFTEANKSSYIDNNLERNVNVYAFIKNLAKTINSSNNDWYTII